MVSPALPPPLDLLLSSWSSSIPVHRLLGPQILIFAIAVELVAIPICFLIAMGRRSPPPKLSFVQTITPFVIVLGIGIIAWVDWQFLSVHVPSWIWGCLGVVFVVALPLCLLILVGYPPMTLSPLIPSATERARWRELRDRPLLDDAAFYQRFYEHLP